MEEMESNSTTSSQTNKTYLVPVKIEVDGSTGHSTWHCRAEEVDEHGNIMQGPVTLHGIDVLSLNMRHRGSHEHFLINHVKPKVLRHYEDYKQDHHEAKQLEGKRL